MSPKREELVGDRVLLVGNPNVGKSVFFSYYTGMNVISSNYPGTTVTFAQGKMKSKDKEAILIDVPGTYSLDGESPAEEVARDFLDQGAEAILFVLDATNLERNLYFLTQVLEIGIPAVVALNLMDMAKRKGIEIDVNRLERELGIKIIPTIATTGEGLDEVLEETFNVMEDEDRANKAMKLKEHFSLGEESRFELAESITNKCQGRSLVKEGFLERLDEWTVRPWPGLLIAFLVLGLSFGAIVGGGMGLRSVIFLPIVDKFWAPLMRTLAEGLVSEGPFLNVLVGEYGVLIKGLEWPFALVLPYVLLFYGVLSLLEDSGYLPRLGILVDGLLRKIGLQGGSIIPMFLGYGCAVPAILGTRARDSHKERLIIAVMITMAVPCVSQSGAFISLLAHQSWAAVIGLYMLSFMALIVAGFIMNKIMRGEMEPTLTEIPPLLVPNFKAYGKKLWMRLKHFLLEAEIPIILAIGIAAILLETGLMEYIAGVVEPLVVNFLGMPPEASMALVFGIVRRELAVLPLVEMDLTIFQLLVGSSVALFYLPCISVFGVLSKEFGIKVSVGLGIFTVFMAFMVGGILNHVFTLFQTFV